MTVKCADCGFLAMRAAADGPELFEVSLAYRTSGEEPASHMGRFPLCMLGVKDVCPPMRRHPSDSDADFAVRCMSQEHSCERHIPWRMGYSPKEHAEMRASESQQQWQTKQDAERKAWEEDRRQEDRRFMAEQRQADLDRAERVRKEDQDRADRIRRGEMVQRWLIAGSTVAVGGIGFLIAWALGLKK